MTLVHIDSCTDRASKTYHSSSPAAWSAIGAQQTGRDSLANGAIGSAQNGSTNLVLATAANDLIFGMALKWLSVASTSTSISFFDSGSVQHLTLNFDATKHLTLRRGAAAGTIIATSTQTLTENVWNYWEFKLVIDDTTGVVNVKVDGVDWINYSGDTRNVGTANVASMRFVRPNSVGSDIYIDDLYVLTTGSGSAPFNDFLGDVAVPRLFLSGNGASSQFVGSDGNSTDNYLLVDEQTLDTADFVDSATAGQQDLYALGNLTPTTGTVHAVAVNSSVGKSDAGARSFKPLDKQSGSARAGSAQVLSVTPLEFVGSPLLTDADSNGWTIARVNSMQVGVEAV